MNHKNTNTFAYEFLDKFSIWHISAMHPTWIFMSAPESLPSLSYRRWPHLHTHIIEFIKCVLPHTTYKGYEFIKSLKLNLTSLVVSTIYTTGRDNEISFPLIVLFESLHDAHWTFVDIGWAVIMGDSLNGLKSHPLDVS